MSDEPLRGRFEIVMSYEDLSAPVEGELKREPIDDADAPCPQCGERSWLLIERRAEPEYEFTRWRALACASCGAADGWSDAGSPRRARQRAECDGDGFPGLPEAPTPHDLARLAPFKILAPSASPTLRSYSHDKDRIVAVTVSTGEVEVRTEIRHAILYPASFDFSPEFLARGRLDWLLWEQARGVEAESYDTLSEPARQLRRGEIRRQAAARAEGAITTSASFDVNGTAQDFTVVATDDVWAAVANVGDETITACGPGPPVLDLSLHAVPPEAPN